MNNDPIPFPDAPAVVAIPVRDEAERIVDCLLALSRQNGPAPAVLLLVNNTTDATMQAVADARPGLRCPVMVIEHRFPAATANAGQARRLALQHADRLAPPGMPLLTTDADGRAAVDWLAANLGHLGRGLDAVFGRAEIDPVEAASIPPSLHQADAEECAYAEMLDEIASRLDPDPDDPWPRHTEHSGASIAVRREVYRAIGGMPAVALGEDRAFHAALRRAGARMRHAPEVRVVVSGRILGRAPGGMADTIRRRLVAPDTMLDDALEPVAARVRRIRLLVAARRAFASGCAEAVLAVAAAAGLAPAAARRLFRARGFGEVWAQLDARWPAARVPVAALAAEMAAGGAVLERLRAASLVAA